MVAHPLLGYFLATAGLLNGAWYAALFLGVPLMIAQFGVGGAGESGLGAYGLLGKTAPDYVALPALAVDHDNVLKSWKDVYFQAAPADIADAFKG